MQKVKLLVLAVLAGFLYFYRLGDVPLGFYVDEAATGYNAYSILKTGKDEYGKPWPVAFRFFGSYSPPLHTYLTVPVIAKFGLTPWTIRAVSGLAGIAAVVLVFLFTKSFWGAVLFAISPWAVLYSRAGYELNLGFFLFSLGAAFLFWGLKKPFFTTAGLAVLSLSTYGAHAQLYLAPLLVGAYFLLFRKYTLWGILLAAIIQIPHLSILSTQAFLTKNTLFYDMAITSQAGKISFLPGFLANGLAFLHEFLSRFLTYFSPRSLFFLPDPDPQRSMPELSVFYPWMIIPYIAGLLWLFKNHKTDLGKFLTIMLLITPLPASLTRDPFSTQRALPLLFPLMLLLARGADRLARPLLFILVIGSLLFLWRSYFVLLPAERAQAWNWGFEQLAEEIKSRPDKNFVIDQTRIKPAYIELAFFLAYPPEKFQKEVDQSIKEDYYNKVVFDPGYKFANIETRNIFWEEDIYKEQILVGDLLAISEQQAKEHFLTKVFEIKDRQNKVVFQGYETNPSQKKESTSEVE